MGNGTGGGRSLHCILQHWANSEAQSGGEPNEAENSFTEPAWSLTILVTEEPRRSVNHAPQPEMYLRSSRRVIAKFPVTPRPQAQDLLCTAREPHRPLAATSSSDHGSKVPTTETSGCYRLLVECGHQSHEPRDGGLKRVVGQGCLRFRQRYPRHDQSWSPSRSP